MADKVYPSAKPTTNNAGAGAGAIASANGGANPTFPANKAQKLYNTNRPSYRPQPPPRRGHRRSCCCRCCLWTTFLILIVLLLAAVAGAVFYVLYRPHRPSFSLNSLQLKTFNLTDNSLASSFNISVTARNPNEKITFSYDQTQIQVFSGDLGIGGGSFPGFIQGTKNGTTLRAVVSRSNDPFPDGTDVTALKSSLRSKNLPLKIQLDTKIQVRIGKIKTRKLAIRVTCVGLKISIPTGKTATSAVTSHAKCNLDPRIKIIRWTV